MFAIDCREEKAVKKTVVVSLLILLLAGCIRTRPYIKYTKLTDVPIVTQQELSPLPDEVMKKLIERDEKLKSYIITLESKINKYNESVKRSRR